MTTFRSPFRSPFDLVLIGALVLGGCGDDPDDDGAAEGSSTGEAASSSSSSDESSSGSASSTTAGPDGSSSGDDTESGTETETETGNGPVPETTLGMERIGRFEGEGAEISAFDPDNDFLYVTFSGGIQVLDVSDPTMPMAGDPITFAAGEPTSVAVFGGILAVALPDEDTQLPGEVVFFDATGNELSRVTVGALPDMVTFSPDGARVLVANEGEPASYVIDPAVTPPDLARDPLGSVSIIDTSGDIAALTDGDVTQVEFADADVEASDIAEGFVRIFGPGASVGQDLEPEYIAVSSDSSTAWVTLQENNAVAIVDIATGTVRDIFGMGLRDHSVEGAGIDASDADETIGIQPWPVRGMPMPDAIAWFEIDRTGYVITANEGDARDYDGIGGGAADEEAARIADLTLDPDVFPNAADLQQDAQIGRLEVSPLQGDIDGDGDFDELHSFGSRSISIFDEAGTLVWDSGDEIERVTAERFPAFFNSTDDEAELDNRSDNKGPEPEGVEVGVAFGRPYAFVALERMGGVMVWDLSDPTDPQFVLYTNPRNFEDADQPDDLAPEGVLFVSAEDSPTDDPLLVVSNEVSGSVSIYALSEVPVP